MFKLNIINTQYSLSSHYQLQYHQLLVRNQDIKFNRQKSPFNLNNGGMEIEGEGVEEVDPSAYL